MTDSQIQELTADEQRHVWDAWQAALADAQQLREALRPFLRLDHDIGDEWAEDCQRAREAMGDA